MGKRRLVSNHKRVARFKRTSLPYKRFDVKRLTSSTSEKTESYCSRKMIRAFVRSYGESSTETLSPGTIRMKCLRILPEICARTLRWPGRSTRNIVPGKTCVTVPSVMICSSFAIARRIYRASARRSRLAPSRSGSLQSAVLRRAGDRRCYSNREDSQHHA